MLHFAMVNHNDYLGRGGEYVRKLTNGIQRFAPLNRDFRFTILTEADTPGVEGWWAKMFLFQPDLFKPGDRVVYFDLDTILVDDIGFLTEYDGPFAMIEDFFHPQMRQSGVMTWPVGDPAAKMVWDYWTGLGRPTAHYRGDGGFIADALGGMDVAPLQQLFPGKIVSLKAHCKEGVPEGASVVCFHGTPRPHHLADLMRHW